ncbi:hypothetical protein OQA88_2226 [Cercophora sp. LCS_1]
MPLVVPGITSNKSGNKTEEWSNLLVGKTLSDEPSTVNTFCKTELPQPTRIIEPGMLMTRDHVPERLNVHLKEDGTVSHVHHG